MSRRKLFNQSGSVLIASLWAVSVLSVYVSGVAFQAGQQAVLLKRENSHFQSRVDALSAVNLAGQLIYEDESPKEDHAEDVWYGKVELPDPWKTRVELFVTPEESRIDLNKASENLLRTLFETIDSEVTALNGESQDFAEGVLKLRGEREIVSLEELYLIEDIDKRDLEVLRPFITVYTKFSGFNINTVDPVVLKAFIQSLPGDDYAKEDLLEAIMQMREGSRSVIGNPYFLNLELDPYLFLEKLELTPTVTMVYLMTQLSPYLSVDARTWRLKIKTESDRYIETVIQENELEQNFSILSWREY